jgi:TatD DNase family protein
MKLVDSHCHLDLLDLTAYQGSLDRALESARQQNVCHFLCAGITLESFPLILNLSKQYSDVSCAVGVQPSEREGIEPSVELLIEYAEDDHVVAIGETGLDYYYHQGDLSWQRDRFRQHIRAAKFVNKPLIIHLRQASLDLLTILKEEHAESVGGVMHCFTDTWDVAKQALDLNFYISISGIVTFPKADNVREIIPNIPFERLLIETDSPYLAPVPMRGKHNEPSYLHYTAEYLAHFLHRDVEELAQKTTENFFRLFKRRV